MLFPYMINNIINMIKLKISNRATLRYLGLITLLFLFIISCKEASSQTPSWKMGIQSYTFHKFSFKEAVDKTHELGLNYIEIYYGQQLGEGIEGTMDYRMDEETQKKVLEYAKSKDVEIKASGVVIPNNEHEWDQLFSFAQKMGISIITSEPKYEHLPYVDKLANKYNIDVAIHNHPKPSNYWNPDLFLEAVEGLSDRIGGCPDVGHWARMGLDPVECLKKYEGRIKSLHFKDIKSGSFEEDGGNPEERHDVIWGTGSLDLKAMLQELKRQNFNGLISIEYEYNWDNSLPDIKNNIEYYNEIVKGLS